MGFNNNIEHKLMIYFCMMIVISDNAILKWFKEKYRFVF